MNSTASEDKGTVLLGILRELLDPDFPLAMDTELFAAGLDSMAMMQLLIAIETRLGKTIPVREATRANFQTPRAILSLLEA